MRIKNCLVFTLIGISLFLNFAHAQQNITFGEIPDSVFMPGFEKQYDFPFIFLSKTAHTEFKDDDRSIIAQTKHHVRIKILNETGLQSAVVGIPYLNYLDMEKITHIDAHSFDGRFFVRLDTAEIKTIQVNSRVSFREFQIPGAKEGSVIEYQYTMERRFIEELPAFYMQEHVPVLYSEYGMRLARYLRYNTTIQQDVVPIEIKRVEVDTSTGLKLFTRRAPEKIITDYWIARNIPAFNAEPFVLSGNDFRMHLRFNWSEFGIPLQVIEANWDLVSAELSKENGLEKNIQKAKKWKAYGDSIGALPIEDSEKIERIFKRVQSLAKYNEKSSLLSEVNPDSLFIQPFQDAATINQALIAALRGAGFKTWPVFTTPMHANDLAEVYPTKYQFEKMLVAVEIKDDFLFLDASDRFAHVGMIPSSHVNQKGFILKGFKNYEWKRLVSSQSVFEQQIYLKGELDKEGNLIAKISGQARGYLARDMREKMAENRDLRDHFKALLFSRYFNMKIEPVQILANAADSISFEFSFSLPNAANVIDKGLAFKPLVIGYLEQNPFQKETRQLPIQFKASEILVLNVLISLPKGYNARSKPAELNYGFAGADIRWQQFDSRNVDYRFQVELSQLDYQPDSYPQIKRLYDLWQEWSSAEIVIFKP